MLPGYVLVLRRADSNLEPLQSGGCALMVDLPAQVAHFDKLRDQDVRRVRELHANINDNHHRAKGVEAGKPLN